MVPVLLLAVLLLVAVGPAQAVPGDPDPSFGTGGKVLTDFGSGADEADGLALQPDGKVIAGGYIQTSTAADFGLARYNPNGSLDTSFGTGGKLTTDFGYYDWISGVVVQPGGKIVAAGLRYTGSTPIGSIAEFALARYNADGSLDSGFGSGGKATTAIGTGGSYLRGIVLQPDGKIVVAGFTINGSNYDFALVRYNPDGLLDTSFGAGGKVTTDFGQREVLDGIALQSDGKLVAAGYTYGLTDRDFALARYNPDGSLDTSFGAGGKVVTAVGIGHDYAYALVVQPDGKIVVSGESYASGTKGHFTLVRYNADGSLDTSFGTGGKVRTELGTDTDAAVALALQPNGKIVAAGYTYGGTPARTSFALARYNANGSLDTSFGTGGTLTAPFGPYDDYVKGVVLQTDGKIVAGGTSRLTSDPKDSDFALARYLGDSHTLKASKRGSGKGTVASTPSGIDCGSVCSAQFADASSVKLTATPRSGSVFSGWSGDCSGKKRNCKVTMSAERSVRAEFSICVVPKVKGKPLAKAKRALRRAHCSVGKVKAGFSSRFKKGRVSAQKPKPGAKRPAGSKVKLVVSKGKR